MSLIKKLKDELNNIVFPETKIKAVSDDTGKTLDVVLSEMNNNLVDKTTWKYLGSTIAENAINLPSEYKEIYANIHLNQDAYFVSMIIPQSAIVTPSSAFQGGHYYNSSNNCGFSVMIEDGKGKLDEYYVGGRDYSANATVKWYYR